MKKKISPEEAARRQRERARKEKNFMRRATALSLIAFAALTVSVFSRYAHREETWMKKAEDAIKKSDYAAAEKYLEKLGAGREVPEGQEPDEKAAAAQEMLNGMHFEQARSFMEAGRLEEAEAVFSSLGEYGGSRAMISECRYRAAAALEQAGEYEAAEKAYAALAGYADSLTRQDACRFQRAAALEEAGRLQEAYALYKALGTFGEAKDRTERVAVAMTGVEDPALAVQLCEGYSKEEIAAIEALVNARAALPGQVLATGFYHTAGVTKDGTVVCCGRNDEGQCGTGSWNGVVAVAAGAYHTAALKADGTVVCCGRNDENECDTAGWTDVTAIACTYYGTVGLRSDGTVLYTGFHPEEGPGSWQGISAIGAGAYITAGVRTGGGLVSTHPSAADDSFTNLVAADADTGYALALTQDGRVLSTAGETGWTGCTAISAGPNGCMALTSEGRVLVRYFDGRNALDFSDITNAVAISMGGTHAAVLLKDGTVVARGSNGYGECGTASFSLKTVR